MRSLLLTTAFFKAVTTALPGSTPVNSLWFPGNTRLDYCSPPGVPLIEVTSINIKTGSQKVVTYTAKAKTDITDGAITAISLKYPFFGGPGQEFNFCKDLGVKCPVAAGSTFTATHNLTLKTWPGFAEEKHSLSLLVARSNGFPFDFLLCVEGPWKASSTGALSQWPLVEKSEEHWEMK